MPPKKYRLESTGIPAGVHGAHSRALGEVGVDVGSLEERLDGLDASQIPYTPAVDADWNGDPPATVADALDRIAAFVGPVT